MSPKGGKREGAGRPAIGKGVKSYGFSLTEEQVAWLDTQPGTRSEVVRQLIDQAMNPASDQDMLALANALAEAGFRRTKRKG